MQIQKNKIPILMYHSISYTTNSKFCQFTVSPVSFAEQMAYLHQHGYTPITVTHFINTRSDPKLALPERPVILTFDDGFADFFLEAFPVLKRYNFAATLYVSTAFIGETSRWLQLEGEATRPMLTWHQLTEISANGIECGAHSHSHPQLDTLPCTVAQDEIVGSKKILEDHLGKQIYSFAYPYGYQTARLQQLTSEAGYTSACAVKHRMSSATDNAFALARLLVSADMHNEGFEELLIGHSSSPLKAAHDVYARARTPLWQIARRCSALVTRHL